MPEQPTNLTEHDYKFLKGDEVHWPRWGAAFGVVMDYLKHRGYGEFGKPTERGIEEMKKYEKFHRL